MSEQDSERILFVANRIARSSSHEWPQLFEELRRRGKLSAIVRGLNYLLEDPAYRELAKSALKRFGLEHAG
jgi:hypothetical protein